MSITFYNTPQSSADRVHATLKALGVPYEEVRVDLRAGDQKKPEFLALNPNGKVPLVVLDGTPIFESVAIQIALGERYGVEKGLWPAIDSPDHLTALSWLLWGQVNITAAVFRYMQHTSEYFPAESRVPAQAEAAMKDIKELLGILDARLGGREYLVGDRTTLADIDLGSVLGWGLMMAKVDLSSYPNVGAWLGRLRKYFPSYSAS